MAKAYRVAVLGSGNGSNMQALLERIASGHVAAKVTLVVSDKPDARILVKARKAGVAAVLALPVGEGEKRGDYDRRMLEVLLREKPDLVVLAGYMRIVGKALIEAFDGRIINIHPSLLPRFKGLHAVQQALDAKVSEAGCSVHVVTADLDGGPILMQAGLRVKPAEKLEDLQKRILALEHLILPRVVQLFATGAIQGRPAKVVGAAVKDSWRIDASLPIVSGAWYGEGF